MLVATVNIATTMVITVGNATIVTGMVTGKYLAYRYEIICLPMYFNILRTIS